MAVLASIVNAAQTAGYPALFLLVIAAFAAIVGDNVGFFSIRQRAPPPPSPQPAYVSAYRLAVRRDCGPLGGRSGAGRADNRGRNWDLLGNARHSS